MLMLSLAFQTLKIFYDDYLIFLISCFFRNCKSSNYCYILTCKNKSIISSIQQIRCNKNVCYFCSGLNVLTFLCKLSLARVFTHDWYYIHTSKMCCHWHQMTLAESIIKNMKIFCIFYHSSKQINGLVQDCSNSIANTLELLQSYAKPSVMLKAVKSFLMKNKVSFILYSQYQCCWWLGYARSQGISSHMVLTWSFQNIPVTALKELTIAPHTVSVLRNDININSFYVTKIAFMHLLAHWRFLFHLPLDIIMWLVFEDSLYTYNTIATLSTHGLPMFSNSHQCTKLC